MNLGGMMDQYSAAIGNIIYLQSEPEISIQRMSPNLGTFVLGDSGEPIDTLKILSRCRDARFVLIELFKIKDSSFDIRTCDESVDLSILNEDQKVLLQGTLINRDLLISCFVRM